ncbi:hypothetical protein BDR03DRAFT_969160 [Suillus americanus]|nr:hypothetical protein BDR03DRAFT_969160 [Suillus americanus]
MLGIASANHRARPVKNSLASALTMSLTMPPSIQATAILRGALLLNLVTMYLLMESFDDAVPASHFYFRAATSTCPIGRRSQFRTGIWEKSRSYADSIARDTDSVEGKQNAGGSCRSSKHDLYGLEAL